MKIETKKDKSTYGTSVKLTPQTYKYIQKIKEVTGANNSFIVWKAIVETYKDIIEGD